MKFNHIALASLATVAALGAGTAQAQSSVTIYGVADAYVQVAKGASTLTRLQSGGLNGSRIGFRGNEDLGGGLRGLFVLESGINIDDGSVGQNVFWGRQAYVGLGGNYGTVTLGRQYGSVYSLSSDFSEFSNVSTGASTALIGGFGGYEPVRGNSVVAATGSNQGPARINNSIKLESANYGGFRGGVVVGLGEVSGGTKGNRVADIYGRYTAGPFDAMLSFVDDKADVTGLAVRTTSVAAAYSFGDLRATGGLISVNDRSVANADGQGYWIGADYRMGANLFKAQWVQNKNKGALADGKTTALGAGYQYDLSKRTALYTNLTYFKNEGAVANRWSGGLPAGLTTGTDRNITEYVAGIRHSF